jgi:putative nucleotidyltransferase with HDIG domain
MHFAPLDAALTPHATTPAQSAADGENVLVVDDEDSVRSSLARLLSKRGFHVSEANSAAAALTLLESARFAAMVCDIRMPGMSGLELLGLAVRADPELAVLMLTGANDAGTAREALCGGAMDYLVKPLDSLPLDVSVRNALHKRALLREQRRVDRLMREEAAQHTSDLEREKAALRDLTINVAETLITAMEAKDLYLSGHSHRVAALAATVAEELGLDANDVEHVRLAGRLHDVGKIGIRESVLNKPASLTAEEYAHVQTHVQIGMQILMPLRHIGVVRTYVQDHHEHWDGTGYPNGLAGEQISMGGRILSAADAFDALTSKRSYRDPLTPAETLEILDKQRGRLLDPAVFDALARVVHTQGSLVFLEVVS